MRKLIATLVMAAMTSGCSFILVDKAPPPPVWKEVKWAECTDSNLWPGVDTTLAVLNGLGTLGLAAGNGTTSSILIGALDTLIWGASAAYGFKHVGRCQAFMRTKGVHSQLFREPLNERQLERPWQGFENVRYQPSLR